MPPEGVLVLGCASLGMPPTVGEEALQGTCLCLLMREEAVKWVGMAAALNQ